MGENKISIHALREEGDSAGACIRPHLQHFYPRPPRGGRPGQHSGVECNHHISIHALREEGDIQQQLMRVSHTISIHALREEGDAKYFLGQSQQAQDFYPRPPRGGRPHRSQKQVGQRCNFYPRPPRGGRHAVASRLFESQQFLSTPSARRATAKTETKSLFSYKLYNILHEFRRALIYNGSKNYPNHAKRLENPVRRCRKDAENSPFAPGRKTQNNSRPSCSKGG